MLLNFSLWLWLCSSVSERDAISAMYQRRSSPYQAHRPSGSSTNDSATNPKRPRLMSDFVQPLRIDVDVRRVSVDSEMQ